VKVLLVSEDLPAPNLGGLAKHAVTLGNALIRAGHEVTFLGRDAPSYEACAAEIGFQGRFIAGFPSPGKGWKEARLGFFNGWKRPYYARRIARAIRQHAPGHDVVHYHGHLPMVGRYLPATLNFVQTRHDQGSDCVIHVRFRGGEVCRERAPEACALCIHPRPGALRTALSAAAVRRYRAEAEQAFARHPVIFVSSFLRENYRKTMPAARLAASVVVHNFVDEAALQRGPAAAPVTPADMPGVVRIHVAGRLDDAKGIQPLLQLLAPRLPPSWRIDVYGDGPLRQELLAQGAGDRIGIHGHVRYDAVIRAARSAHVVVVPSLWEEPCGTVVLEALRLGKPCYALGRGGTPELARYGAPGQLRLFADLPSLVASLLQQRDFAPMQGGESADVHARLPQLLGLYRREALPLAAPAPGREARAAPRISVITVCFNALRELPATLASLRAQTCRDYEWVVVDGASTDGSVPWLAAQAPQVLVSEADQGIYDAMNKAVARASGEWLYFLNAGDRFADAQVLAQVLACIDGAPGPAGPPSILYGDVLYYGSRGTRRRSFHWLTRGRLLFGDLCHQATFVRRSLFAQLGPFDSGLRYNADYDWLLRAFRSGAVVRYLKRDLAYFHDAGTHVSNREASEIERAQVRSRYRAAWLWRPGNWYLKAELKVRRLLGEAT